MKSSYLRVAFLSTLLLAGAARADWAESSDPLVVKPRPANGDKQPQNPPGFTWARHPAGPALYDIEILPAGGAVPISATVSRNWYLPAHTLAAGSYSWRVRPANSTEWSARRTFSISATSTLFEVPDDATLRNRILQHPRPRSLPASFVPMNQWNAGRMAQFEPFTSRMSNEIKSQAAVLPMLSDARWSLAITSPLTANMVAQQTDYATASTKRAASSKRRP